MIATSLGSLFNPRSIAIVGASEDRTRIGGRSIGYMIEHGFAGAIYPINPNRATIQGLKAYGSVDDLPEAPEVALVAVPKASAVTAVDALARRGTKAAIVFTSGFAEADGQEAQDALVAAARAGGMRLLGPNCLGMFSTAPAFYGTFSAMIETGPPKMGPLGIVSQSGAFGAHIVYGARDMGLGIAAAVTTGNEAELTMGEIVGEMVAQDDIGVIAVYSEGFRKADSLIAALSAARDARKPVVMMKVGRSALGAAAAQSHTASLANNDAVIDAVLKEFGVVRARNPEEMLDIAALATQRVYPVSNSLGMFTISGGAGVLVSDVADSLGLPMPAMPDAAQAKLKALLPFSAPRNPVDTTAQFINDMPLFGEFVETMVEEGGYKSILGFLSYTAAVPTIADQLRAELARVRAARPERLYVLSLLGPRETLARFEADGFSTFGDPMRAVIAIEAMGRYGEAFERPPELDAPQLPPVVLPTVPPTEAEAKEMLSSAGIASASERACTSPEEAVEAARGLGFPVVMKILSRDILHKSEIGGVVLDVADEASVADTYDRLVERARAHAPQASIDGVLVARQLDGGVECILGIQQDPVFGPVALFGLGGIFVEALKDTALHRCPFGVETARELILSIRGAALLTGSRGRPAVDIDALARMLSQLSAFAVAAGPRLKSIDLNPVLAMPRGQGAFAVDAVIEIGD